MCVICLQNDEFSIEHLESELKKLKQNELFSKAKTLKDSIKMYTIWSNSNHVDGFEQAAIKQTLAHLLEVQSVINRFM